MAHLVLHFLASSIAYPVAQVVHSVAEAHDEQPKRLGQVDGPAGGEAAAMSDEVIDPDGEVVPEAATHDFLSEAGASVVEVHSEHSSVFPVTQVLHPVTAHEAALEQTPGSVPASVLV